MSAIGAWLRAGGAGLAQHVGPKEGILVLGFVLLFAGLARATVTGALIVCGALLVRLAWPTTPLLAPPLESPRQPRADAPRRG